MALDAAPLALAAAAPAVSSALTVRRAALWGLLVSKVIAGWGVQWDIQWHVLIGRDSFWIAPHLMTHAGVSLTVILSFGVLAWETFASPRPGRDARIEIFGLSGSPGFHIAAWGIALTVLAAPIDDLWHRLFGLDVTLWSPPHLLGILGSVINTLACLLIAREVYPASHGLRAAAIVVSGAMLYGNLHLVVDPSNLVAYRHGGVFFYTLAVLSAAVLPLALVTTARLSGLRWAPALLLLVVIPTGMVGASVARAGFAWLQPVSVIHEEIAKDPTSPVALAYTIARKNGTPPGRTGGRLHVFALLPALIMSALDARRRPRLATLGYALALFVVLGVVLGQRPAMASLVPGPVETAIALGLTAVAALVGGAAARWLSDQLLGAVRLMRLPKPSP
ncbi:MAG TPA: hypothetical protein VGT40_14920 [Methylomirabilota bacterium]|jgi:hypothetical protein|nr:hypothetical protein [Methylomirabilota bacterium]